MRPIAASFCPSSAEPSRNHTCHRLKSLVLTIFHTVKKSATTNTLITTWPEETYTVYTRIFRRWISLCMACTMYVYGICLKWYVAVNVSECLSMETLSVQERCASFYGGKLWKCREVRWWFSSLFLSLPLYSFSLSLSLSISKIWKQFLHVHLSHLLQPKNFGS